MNRQGPPLETERAGDVLVVRLPGSFADYLTSQEIAKSLFALVGEQEERKILLDFSNVQFILSVAISELLYLSQELTKKGGELRLCGVNPGISDVLRVTQVDRLLRIYQDEASALEGF